MATVVLSNPKFPEEGQVTIPLPIPQDEYEHCIELLDALCIGDAKYKDCQIDTIDSGYQFLERLEGSCVNIDELDYLFKRFESFCGDEDAAFQSLAHKYDFSEVKDLINLTFCCDQATVVTDFSNLNAIGKDHYLTMRGGHAPIDDVNRQDGRKIAEDLLSSGKGIVTPYGVVFENSMQMEQIYQGKGFPPYYYEPGVMAVVVTPYGREAAEDEQVWLHLPMPEKQILRSLERVGLTLENAQVLYSERETPFEINDILSVENEGLLELNAMCAAIQPMDERQREKLAAVIEYAEPQYSSQIKHLAENIDLFDFAPGVKTPKEYGEYMIRESGHFDYDENLAPYYDYEKYGEERLSQQSGQFNDYGYVSYHGCLNLDELMMEDPAEEQSFQMGGMI